MGAQDLALRKTAIPYYANVWGYNRRTDSDYDISSTTVPGDLSCMQPSSYSSTQTAISTINAIRVLQPQYGDVIEANLNLKFNMASAEDARQFRIAIGKFSDLYTAQTSYTDAEITASHRAITGRDSAFSIAPGGSFTLPRTNLYQAMYHRGDTNFRNDAFVVLLCFDQAPSKGSGYSFTKFEVDCTMQMGLS